MNLDEMLTDALHDERLALPVPADTLDVVRRKRRYRQRLTVAVTTASAVALVGGAVGAASMLSSPTATVSPYTSGGVPEGSPAPGITPAFVPQSGRDWLMNDAQWAIYNKSHTHPSPAPGQSTVHSPAPLAQQSGVLLSEIQQAGLPDGATFERDDSTGGQPGTAAVTVTLRDGRHFVVVESQLQEPFAYDRSTPTPAGVVLFDVPGTGSAGVAFPGEAPSVILVSRGGILTAWYTSPGGPTPAELRAWATAAEQHSAH